MNDNNIKAYVMNPPDFKSAIKNGDDFYIQFHTFRPDIEAQIIKIIHRYLEEYDILYIKDTIITVVKELINNSIKANLKRLYFKLKELDINKIEEYRQGMENFKIEIYQTNTEEYLDKLEESKLVVRAAFKISDDHIHINVINNIPILEAELNKINARIAKAYKYTDISDAFEDVLDDSEGAGLGLIMAMMLFKNSGLKSDCFKIYRKGDLTIATISIPKNLSEPESRIEITERILKEIDEIPAFPENISEIQKLCSNPETPIKHIAESISRDPGLTTSILKLANSAGYMSIRKVETIEEAVVKIGIKGINTLLVATGVYKIIENRYKRYEAIWKDSYKRAFYAQKIAIQLKYNKISEFAYLAALLADIGRIIMLSVDEKLFKKLREITGIKGLDDSNLLEEISLGMSHSTLGALIGKKWKFNEALISTIELHHRPHMAPEKLKELIYIVYLADAFVEIENKKFRFEFMDEDVLDYFKLADKKFYEQLHKVLKDTYTGTV